MKLQELLGEGYKEGLTVEEVETMIADMNIYTAKDMEKKNTELETMKQEQEAQKKQAEEAQKKQAEEAQKKQAQAQQVPTVKTETQDINKDLEQRLKEIENENKKIKLEKKFTEDGYDAETAIKLSDAMMKSDMEEFTKVNKEYLEKYKTTIESNLKKESFMNMPKINAATDPKFDTEKNIDVEFAKRLSESKKEQAKAINGSKFNNFIIS